MKALLSTGHFKYINECLFSVCNKITQVFNGYSKQKKKKTSILLPEMQNHFEFYDNLARTCKPGLGDHVRRGSLLSSEQTGRRNKVSKYWYHRQLLKLGPFFLSFCLKFI